VLAAVAEERRWVLTEPPTDLDALTERFAASLPDPAWIEFVLEDGGEVVGSLGAGPTGAVGVASLGMGILAGHRGRGGGALLLDAGLEAARRRRDLHKVELEVFPENGRAVALYAARGFRVEGVRHEHHRRRDGSLRTTLLMAVRV
jgi:RimJ/RimL family protein N-acetyltransferase